MSVSASHCRSAFQPVDLNVSRIAAISTAASVHITAFLFLMAPIALPDRLVRPETITQIVLPEPPKPVPGGEELAPEIGIADFAIAMLDEVEQPKHSRQRFTVGY